MVRISSAALRRELSQRNLAIAGTAPHECTWSDLPSVIYQDVDGTHGNFMPASYRRILASPEWRRRLEKHYSNAPKLPRRGDRIRRELDCANSSDALLMNIFCYPGVTSRRSLCALLGIDPGSRPQFGVRPGTPLVGGGQDRTETDMVLGHLFVEAKLTEGAFQSARPELVLRYNDVEKVFDLNALRGPAGFFESYQLIRSVLAAHHCSTSFLLLYDIRRLDLREQFFRVLRAVRSCEMRSRLASMTWQELNSALPRSIQTFLLKKYGIAPDVCR